MVGERRRAKPAAVDPRDGVVEFAHQGDVRVVVEPVGHRDVPGQRQSAKADEGVSFGVGGAETGGVRVELVDRNPASEHVVDAGVARRRRATEGQGARRIDMQTTPSADHLDCRPLGIGAHVRAPA